MLFDTIHSSLAAVSLQKFSVAATRNDGAQPLDNYNDNDSDAHRANHSGEMNNLTFSRSLSKQPLVT